MAKFVKKCGVYFKYREWGISEVHSVKVKRNIPRETLCALERVVISKNHVTTVSYCWACVDYANKNVSNVAKTKKCQYKTKYIDTECQTDFPKYTDPRGNLRNHIPWGGKKTFFIESKSCTMHMHSLTHVIPYTCRSDPSLLCFWYVQGP